MRAVRIVVAILIAAGVATAQATRTEDRKLTVADPIQGPPRAPMEGDGFGDPVDISGDLMVIGAFGTEGRGAVHLYRLTGGVWTPEKTILQPGASGYFGFSAAVSVTPTRQLLAMGSLFEDT